ncbi:hypothetical protein Tsubulata_038152 [Turnera subulata]|uniref:Non-specific lipid-transfer protein n=1 Tax=Turnera subulata TaxID=218843 RepID=A0A9Q0GA88_9ROSI|nr:hypothetical protein Tsubulata_038152 [Turnera subulata]
MKGAVMSVLVVLAMVQFMAKPGEAITCGEVNSYLVACLPYLSGQGATPPAPCCAGVSKLKDSAATTADRQAACNCVKAAAASLPNIKDDAASSLPAKCNVQIGIPISRNVNCNNIN